MNNFERRACFDDIFDKFDTVIPFLTLSALSLLLCNFISMILKADYELDSSHSEVFRGSQRAEKRIDKCASEIRLPSFG